MYVLQADERLWGDWPLVFLFAAWMGVVLLRQRPERITYLGWSSAAGILLGISLAPYGALWAPMAGMVMLLILIDRLAMQGASKRQVFWYAYHTMVLFNVIATWWVANTAIAAGIVANFLNALFMAAVVLLMFLARRRLPQYWLGAAVCLWIGFEFLHFNWQIAWPWLCLGHTFATAAVLAQWFSVTGVFGGSLYIMVGAVILYRVYACRHEPGSEYEVRPVYKRLSQALLVVVGPLLVSVLMYAYAEEVDAPIARVAVVQPNFEPHYQKFRTGEREQLAQFRDLTKRALDDLAQLVIYPETSFSSVDEASLEAEAFVGMWDELSAGLDKLQPALITGLSSYRRYARPIADPALRTQQIGQESLYYMAHNSAIAIDGSVSSPLYYKSKLVPGVEFLPYRKVFFLFEPLVASLGGTTAGLGKSDSAAVFPLRTGIVAAPLICYESIYGDYVREFVKAGANVLVVPTNDGWWDDSPGYRQHWHFARLRAIETRRWVVQAANSGTSGFIDQRGRAVAKTKYNEDTVLVEEVQLLSGTTLYVRFGDVIGWIMAFGAVGSLCAIVAKPATNRPISKASPPAKGPT